MLYFKIVECGAKSEGGKNAWNRLCCPGYQRRFSRVRPDALVSAAGRQIFRRRPKPRAPKPDNGHETSLAPYNLPFLKLA